jgi:group I intron endonuclease
MIIYLIRNIVNDMMYVGQHKGNTPDKRFREHLIQARSGSEVRLHKAIREIGEEFFTVELIDKASSFEELQEKERCWIAYYKSNDPNIGYNVLPGGTIIGDWYEMLSERFSGSGNPMYGKSLNKESLAKAAETKRKNKWVPTKEWREKQSKRMSGINNPMFGKKLEEESKTKMRNRWAERRKLGLKMNLTEEAREIRREQARNMRLLKQAASTARQEVLADGLV